MNERSTNKEITINRDCDAILIPSAQPILIHKGTVVALKQALGGSFTVNLGGNLARIESINADALGFVECPAQKKKKKIEKTITGSANEDEIWEQLKTCYDPEIPVNIVDLGLIYRCDVVDNKDGIGSIVNIDMTLTAPGCAMGDVFLDDIKQKVIFINNVVEVNVELVFDPPWTMDKMTEAAKLQLGLL